MPAKKKITLLTDILKEKTKVTDSGIIFIKGKDIESYLSYQELYKKSLLILNTLQQYGIEAGDELILQIEDNEQFISIFWACLLGGIIPVPVSLGNNDEHKAKLFKIWIKLKNPYVITTEKTLNNLETYAKANKQTLIEEISQKAIITNDNLVSSKIGREFSSSPEDIAFIQFSSGSTGDPKGVTLTHENLVTNIYQMIEGSNARNNDRFLSWMPLTHDMGIIGMHLVPIMLNAFQYFIPTSLFIRRPTLWWIKVNEHRVTITCSPNFGYSYFLSHFKSGISNNWDLSSVRLILNGAEPISPKLCHQFLECLSRYGLKNTVMLTVYGLAEASLGVTFPPLNEKISTVTVERDSLNIGREIVINNDISADVTSFVDVGYPLTGCEVRICGKDGIALGERISGYIQIKGGNVTKGYYNDLEKSKETIKNGWLNTGDVGFLNNGRLIITGRAKDIIFINGQNVYPHDIERVSEALNEIKLGYIVACGIHDYQTQKDQVIIFMLYKKELINFIPLSKALKRHISEIMGVDVHRVIPIKKIPKTTSGKFERYKLARAYANGDFNHVLDELQKLNELTLTNKLLNKQNSKKEFLSFSQTEEIKQIQKNLLLLLKETFDIEEAGIHDNFFDLGGNSLLLVRLHEQINKLYPNKISVTDLFTYPTIFKLAAYIENNNIGALKNINFSPIKVPSIFLNNKNLKQDGSIFQYNFNFNQTKIIRYLCNKHEVDVNQLFLTFFASLLSKISNEQKIVIQTILSDEEIAHSLKILIDNDIDFLNLLTLINDKNNNVEIIDSYTIEDALQVQIDKKEKEIIPLFSKKSIVSSKYNLLNIYDLIIYIEDQFQEISLTLQYNSEALNKETIKKFFNSYIKLVQLFLTKYVEKTKGVLS
ncbi:AMP-binding protein [Priestia aryabhattai]|uniref:non-ribosomal peptide synthetase n=1 Tax=Priestia aryabhattai TaxID=412384 RepID=UPI003D2B6B05